MTESNCPNVKCPLIFSADRTRAICDECCRVLTPEEIAKILAPQAGDQPEEIAGEPIDGPFVGIF